MKKIFTYPLFAFALALMTAIGAPQAFADDDQPVVGTPTITEITALTTATKAYAGAGTFTDIELEMENNVLVYAIEFTENDGNEVDVKVDAKTGAVVLIESDATEAVDDDEGDDEDDGEEMTDANRKVIISLLQQIIELTIKQNSI